jgi:hypothetical protein
MKIPSSVDVMGQEFSVKKRKENKRSDCIGICYAHKNRIEIDRNLHPDKAGETFLHEVIHAIEQNMNLRMTENQVNNLALGLYQFLKNNKINFYKE